MTESLIAPSARARFVVTLPPEPSRIAEQLQRASGASFTTLTDTQDAFLHLASRARDRLVIMTPFIDNAGAAWATDLFEATLAPRKELVVRDMEQLDACSQVERLRAAITGCHAYRFAGEHAGQPSETFHAKIVLADGVAAYVGSANFLYRSKETNLECGFLLEGDAVAPVATLVEAVLGMFTP
ncbi:MAG: hypothetical protein J0M34_08305 [Alphaproteobacteria bacterium]|nr:hypothetical protein [Alphaproteobacteria bacterium]